MTRRPLAAVCVLALAVLPSCATTPDTQVTGPPRVERAADVVVPDWTPAPTTTTTQPTTTTTHYHPPTTTTPPEVMTGLSVRAEPQTTMANGGDCGGWGDLIAAKFPGEESTACRVFIGCESKGNPNAVSATGDHGLAQVNEKTWNKPGHHDPVADWIGRNWHNVYDPATNLEMARRIRAAYGWGMWACY